MIDLNAILMPPSYVMCAYALSSGTDADKCAEVLGLPEVPVNAEEAWRMFYSAATYPLIETLREEYGLDDFACFAVNFALAAELDENFRAAVNAAGGGINVSFALRLFSASREEAANWKTQWFSAEQTLALLFGDTENLKLNAAVLRFLLGAAERGTLPRHLDRLAARFNAPFIWDDLVLPEAQKFLLRHLCERVRQDGTVYGQWGFERTIAYGRGVRALFSGPPGTGKTMAAQVVANELGMELFRVDISSIVSKYIGETEKNLDEVFNEAAKSGGVLFFDEADAIFGKRGEQKDSHDKYANMQTSFLLQRVEEYSGVTLLATNFVSNLDSAFTRRIQIRVDFPIPDKDARLAIWRGLLKPPAPAAGDVDVDFLAERFELTGSEIKNIVLTAAFLAAADNAEIDMQRILRGVSMEYAKTDKIISARDFGGYLE